MSEKPATSGFRFSLKALGGFVALTALGCAALIKAGPWTARVCWSATLLFLVFAILAALCLRDASRSFWIGAAVSGWVYLLLIAGPFSRNFDDKLLTTSLSQWAARAMPQAKPLSAEEQLRRRWAFFDSMRGGATPTVGSGRVQLDEVAGTIRFDDPDAFVANFVEISQALWLLLLALVGGVLARHLAHRPGS
jgi:hypothetical protein